MDGYLTGYGFVGFVNGEKMLFVSESEYYEYLNTINDISIKESNYEKPYHPQYSD